MRATLRGGAGGTAAPQAPRRDENDARSDKARPNFDALISPASGAYRPERMCRRHRRYDVGETWPGWFDTRSFCPWDGSEEGYPLGGAELELLVRP